MLTSFIHLFSTRRRRRSGGQILVLFALALTLLLAAVGVAVDGGNLYAQRRAAQNAADAAALAGLADLARANAGSAVNSGTVAADIASNATANAGSTTGGTTVATTWNFIDNTPGSNLGQTLNLNTNTGVSVIVTKTFPTFFLQILPGMSTLTVNGKATANLQILDGGAGAPFLVCTDALLDNNSVFSGGILDMSTPSMPKIRPQAITNLTATPLPPAPTPPTFVIHASAIGQNDGGCGYNGFKGNGSDPGVTCSGTPCWMTGHNGEQTGPIAVRVAGLAGLQGCDDNFNSGCVVPLPILAQDSANLCPGSGPGSGSDKNLCVVAWGIFQIFPGGPPGPSPSGCNANPAGHCYKAKLLGSAIVTDGFGGTFTPGQSGPLIVRLSS